MTTTLRDIVTNALRDARIIAAEETPSAADAAEGLRYLNQMMTQFAAADVFTGWADLTLNDTFPLEDKHRAGVTAMLQKALSEAFGRPITQDLAMRAQRGESLLLADYADLDPLRMDTAIRRMPSQRIIGYRGSDTTGT